MQEWHRVHLGQMAQSGAGLVMIEATSPTPEGRITHGCVGLWDDRTEAAMASVLQSIRATSAAKMAIQIGHAGRKASKRKTLGGRANRWA